MKLLYKEENYPYFYSNACGKLKGVLLELWQTMAALKGEELIIEKTQDSTMECLSAEAFSYVSPRTLSPEQTQVYHYSTVALWRKWVLVEPTKESFELIPNIIFYFVFTSQVILFIFIAKLARNFLEMAIRRVRRNAKSKKVHKTVESTIGYVEVARLSCFLLSFFVLHLVWQGNFNGNTLITVEKPGTLFSLLLTQFLSGSRKLVIESGIDYFDEEEANSMFGGTSNFIYGHSVKERLRMTCADFSRVGFFYESDFMLYQTNAVLQKQCNLAKIILLPGESTPVPWLTQDLREGRAAFYQFHRNESRKNRERIDFALLTVYRSENLDGALMMRHLEVREFLNAIDFMLARYSITDTAPMSLEQASVHLSILIVGLTVSLIIFYCEFVWFYSRRVCCTNGK